MEKTCQQCDTGFETAEREEAYCNQLGFPVPQTCPACRLQAAMATRNEWKLYKRKCDFTGDDIISAYPPDSPFKVYKNEIWWGNDWNALDYGRDYDLNRPFFEQFAELQKDVPREGTSVFSCENCDYNSHIRESRNCYLNSLVYRCEDICYSSWMVGSKDVFDSLLTNDSTLCYECANVNNSYECVMLEESDNCNNCHFSYQLRGCDHCLYCSNLANKSYHILNKPCTEGEFEKAKNDTLNGSYTRWLKANDHYLEMRKAAVHKFAHNINCENCSGDHLYNCKNCENCYDGFDSEDCANSVSLSASKNVSSSYSAGWPNCEGVYRSAVTRGSKDIAYCTYTWFSGSMRYCDGCNACDSCFGCIGLQHKKHCILNKQYTKEEYEELMPKIVKQMKQANEWGEFFPPELSPHAYNETAAFIYYPLDKDEVTSNGWRWREKDKKEYLPATIKEIPDNLQNAPDNISEEILACEKCTKNYKIIKQELEFYKKISLPIPHFCPDCRYDIRFRLRNPHELIKRKCDKCKSDIETTYSPERPEKVYCEKCYLETVY